MQISDAAMTPVFESVGLRSLGGARAKPKAVESPDGGTPIPWGAVSLPSGVRHERTLFCCVSSLPVLFPTMPRSVKCAECWIAFQC